MLKSIRVQLIFLVTG